MMMSLKVTIKKLLYYVYLVDEYILYCTTVLHLVIYITVAYIMMSLNVNTTCTC